MKQKRFILFSITILISGYVVSQTINISGNVFLQNQSNHDQISVIFNRIAPSTLNDTAYSDGAGYYNTQIETGVYEIIYSKTGYLSDTITNIPLYADSILSDLTLISMGLYGSLNGTLVSGVYYVGGDIWVDPGQTLIIEPGTILQFDQDLSFTIDGKLLSIGTITDSIIYTAYNNAIWGGISFTEYADSSSAFSYCMVEKSNDYGMFIYKSKPLIKNTVFRRNNRALKISGVSLTLEHLDVYENVNTIPDHSCSSGITIVGSQGGNTVTIKNSVIRNNSNNTSATAFCVSGGLYFGGIKGVIINTLITNNDGKTVGGICFDSSPGGLAIYNCVIDNNYGIYNSGGIESWAWTDAFSITNSIISNNSTSQGDCGGIRMSSDSHITYCDFWNNASGDFYNQGAIIGNIVTTNINGIPSDGFYNIFEDPGYLNASADNYLLASTSPCIESGVNDSVFYNWDIIGNSRIIDIDNNSVPVVDMGPYEMDTLYIVSSGFNNVNHEFIIYPNPTEDYLYVKTNSLNQDLIIELYDIDGKMLGQKEMQKKTIQFDLSKYSIGNYLLKVSDKNGKLIRSLKIVKK